MKYVTITEACALTGRSTRTLKRWIQIGMPIERRGTFPDNWLVSTDVLAATAREQIANYRSRPIRPGSGRGNRFPSPHRKIERT